LNKLADASSRFRSEAPEVVRVPGPIAALFAPLWKPVPQLLSLSYSS